MNLLNSFGSVCLAEAAPPAPGAVESWVKANPYPTAIIAVLAIAIIVLGALLYRLKTVRVSASGTSTDEEFRHIVAKSVLYSAIWGTVVVAALAIIIPGNTDRILTLLRPVFGTWGGTLLAYYFGKENYESSARNSADLAKAMTGLEKLKGIPVQT